MDTSLLVLCVTLVIASQMGGSNPQSTNSTGDSVLLTLATTESVPMETNPVSTEIAETNVVSTVTLESNKVTNQVSVTSIASPTALKTNIMTSSSMQSSVVSPESSSSLSIMNTVSIDTNTVISTASQSSASSLIEPTKSSSIQSFLPTSQSEQKSVSITPQIITSSPVQTVSSTNVLEQTVVTSIISSEPTQQSTTTLSSTSIQTAHQENLSSLTTQLRFSTLAVGQTLSNDMNGTSAALSESTLLTTSSNVISSLPAQLTTFTTQLQSTETTETTAVSETPQLTTMIESSTVASFSSHFSSVSSDTQSSSNSNYQLSVSSESVESTFVLTNTAISSSAVGIETSFQVSLTTQTSSSMSTVTTQQVESSAAISQQQTSSENVASIAMTVTNFMSTDVLSSTPATALTQEVSSSVVSGATFSSDMSPAALATSSELFSSFQTSSSVWSSALETSQNHSSMVSSTTSLTTNSIDLTKSDIMTSTSPTMLSLASATTSVVLFSTALGTKTSETTSSVMVPSSLTTSSVLTPTPSLMLTTSLISNSSMMSFSDTSSNPTSATSPSLTTQSMLTSIITTAEISNNLSSVVETSVMPSQTISTISSSISASHFISSISSGLSAVSTSQMLLTSLSEVSSASSSLMVFPTPALSTGLSSESSLISTIEESSSFESNLTSITATTSVFSVSPTSGHLTSVLQASGQSDLSMESVSVSSNLEATSTAMDSVSLSSSTFETQSFFSGSTGVELITTSITATSSIPVTLVSSTFGIMENATSTPASTSVLMSSGFLTNASGTTFPSTMAENNSSIQSFSKTIMFTPTLLTQSTIFVESSGIASETIPKSSAPSMTESFIETTSLVNITINPSETTESIAITTTVDSIVTSPIINFTVLPSETIPITGTPSSEYTDTVENITSQVGMSSAHLTSLHYDNETTNTIEMFSSVAPNFSTPVFSTILSTRANFSSMPEQSLVSLESISETLTSQAAYSSKSEISVNETIVEQTSVEPTVETLSILITSAIFSSESMMTGIAENASMLTTIMTTNIFSTGMISIQNVSETITSTMPLPTGSTVDASLQETSSLDFASDLENRTVVMLSSTVSSFINQSIPIVSTEKLSSGFLTTQTVSITSQQSTIPSLSGSLQSSTELGPSPSIEFTSEHFVSTSLPKASMTTVLGQNQTEHFSTEMSPTIVSNISSTSSTEQLESSSLTATSIETVSHSMPSLLTSSSMINSVESDSLSPTMNMNISTAFSPVLTLSTVAASASSMSIYSSLMLSELLTSTETLSTRIETMSTTDMSPVLSTLVMDNSSTILVTDKSSTFIVTDISSSSTEVDSSFLQTMVSTQSSSFASEPATPSLPLSSEGVTTVPITLSTVLSSALPSATPEFSTQIPSTFTVIPDTTLTSIHSSSPITTEIPTSSVIDVQSSTQAAVSISATPTVIPSINSSSEVISTPTSPMVTSILTSTEQSSSTSTLSPSLSSSPVPTSQILQTTITGTSSSLSNQGTTSIMPSPATSSPLPETTVTQSSTVEVSASTTSMVSMMSSVASTVSSITTTLIPSSSVQMTETTPETTETATEMSSTATPTTPSTHTGNSTQNATTEGVPSSTTEMTTTIETTTTPTTTTSTTTTPRPTLAVDVVRTYWVVTVLKIPMNVDVSNKTFISSMEQNFASAYVLAFERQKQIADGTFVPLRRRRAAQVQDTIVTILNATRTVGTGNVTFVYNITKNGTEVRSEEAVRTLGLLSDQEMALTLGYVVAEKASTYYGRNSGGLTPTEDNNLWIVGVAVGAIVLIIIVIWVIFCFIIKKRGPERSKEGEPPHLIRMKGGTKNDESVEMVQSPSNSTQNVKKRQSYEVTKESDLENPIYATVKKPGKKPSREDSTAGDSVTVASDDTGLLSSPSKKDRRKKKKKPTTEEFDNIEKETHVGSSAPPHPTRESKPMSVEDETEYQRKVAEERRKNKKRLREKRRREGHKKEDTEDMMKEYLAVQEEIDSVLDAPPQEGEMPEVFKNTSKGSKKKRRRKAEGQKNEGFEQENLTDAKKRMHKLLDDAFALITPKLDETSSEGSEDKLSLSDDRQVSTPEQNRGVVKSPSWGSSKSGSPGDKSPVSLFRERNKVFPEEEISIPWKNEEEQTPEKKHEPMFINPSYHGSRREGLTTWSPYRAADEVTLISMPKTVVPEEGAEKKSHHSKRPAVNLPEPVPMGSYTTQPPKPIILRSLAQEKTSTSSKRPSDSKPYLHNGFGSREETDIDQLKSSYISQSESGRVKSANGDLTQKPPLHHQKPFKRTPEGEDMTDVVSKSIHAGETPENTITAVRNELQNIVHPTVVTVSSGGWTGSSSGGMADIA